MKAKDFVKFVGWDLVNPALLRAKAKTKRIFPEGFHGINLGCGIDNPEKWVGVDGGFSHYAMHTLPKPLLKLFFKSFNMSKNYSFEEYSQKVRSMNLVHHELQFGLPYNDNTIPNIYSSHFFEHLSKSVADNLLKECNRVMKADGVIRICVPSLEDDISKIESAISEYRNGNQSEIQKFFTSDVYGFNSMYANHRFMYTNETLSHSLADAGFKNVSVKTFRSGEIPDVEKLDTRKGIYVEAMK